MAELEHHIAQIAGSPERLLKYMTSKDVLPTQEHWRCLEGSGLPEENIRELAKLSGMVYWQCGGRAYFSHEHCYDVVWRLTEDLLENGKPTARYKHECLMAYEDLVRNGTWDFPQGDWYQLWPDPANRIPAWRTEEERKVLANGH